MWKAKSLSEIFMAVPFSSSSFPTLVLVNVCDQSKQRTECGFYGYLSHLLTSSRPYCGGYCASVVLHFSVVSAVELVAYERFSVRTGDPATPL